MKNVLVMGMQTSGISVSTLLEKTGIMYEFTTTGWNSRTIGATGERKPSTALLL